MRIFSRRSFCSPFITPMMTISALTPTIDAANGDHADQRQQSRAAPAPQIAPGDRQLEASSFGPQRGKEDHVANVRRSVRYMNSRSMPMPTPPVGGMPYSIARR